MAQLSDDCFAFGGPMLTIDEAGALIRARTRPLSESALVALGEADGRTLAQDVMAPLALPPFANSAVDGYAARFADLAAQGETVLRVAGRVEAGAAASALAPGAAARVFTGAPMPAGADMVFMQEDVRAQGGEVALPAGLKRGANMRPAGEDVALGACALPKGRILRPQDLALAAALGFTHLPVVRRLRVGVFSTGNELAQPGEPLGPAQIYDSNRVMLLALLRRLGCEARDLGALRDEPAALADALKAAAAQCDLIVTSGGVSTGEADHVKAAAEAVGTLVFWRIAVKPGRPVAMGVIDGAPFVGLPGNPAASFVTFACILRPLVCALGGAQAPVLPLLPVRADFSYRKKAGRREFVRACLAVSPEGATLARKFAREGAGLLSSLTQTDGLVVLGEDVTSVAPGDLVGFLAYSALG
jgi:molybdopterin molybdotransferase